VAFDEVKSSDFILPNFMLNYYEVNLGCIVFIEEFARDVYFSQKEFGVELFGAVTYYMAIGAV